MQAVDCQSSDHHQKAAGYDAWTLLSHPRLTVEQQRLTPGTASALQQRTRTLQFWYVLRGLVSVELDGSPPLLLSSGQGLPIPPGMVFRLFNAGTDDLELLAIGQPGPLDDREPAVDWNLA